MHKKHKKTIKKLVKTTLTFNRHYTKMTFERVDEKMEIILASHSPRRKEILQNLGLSFQIITSETDESWDHAQNPEDVAMQLSRKKALAVAEKLSGKDALVIGADTIVVFKNQIFGKPKDKADARQTLQLLSAQTHSVISGLTLCHGSQFLTDYAETQVRFDRIPPNELERYINTNEPYDKAGGYAIQGTAALWIRSINGCYFNVVGFPVHLFYQMQHKMGLDLFGGV